MKGRKIALLTAVILVGVVAITGCPKKEPPPPPPPTPEIQAFTHDADGPRKPGDRINFKASGVIPEGGKIVVDIPETDATTTLTGSGGTYSGGLTLPELRPGTYQLRARVMDASGNVVATMLADAPLTMVPAQTACDLAVDAVGKVRARFAFDSYKLDDAAKASIQKVATALKDAKKYDLVIEGHCDERGTIEYNLALGENRARVTREYLLSLGGVDAGSVRIVSYGEERPIDPASNESAWAKNRRAQFALTCN